MARAVAKTEEESALALMEQIRERYCPDHPPAMATDGKGAYREAMVRVWGQVPAYSGRAGPAARAQTARDRLAIRSGYQAAPGIPGGGR